MIRKCYLKAALCSLLLLIGSSGQAMDRAALDKCEAKLSALYEHCKLEHSPRECNLGLTTRLCGFTWNEDFEAFQDRRIEESAAPGMPHVFVGLTRLKPSYVTAGGK